MSARAHGLTGKKIEAMTEDMVAHTGNRKMDEWVAQSRLAQGLLPCVTDPKLTTKGIAPSVV